MKKHAVISLLALLSLLVVGCHGPGGAPAPDEKDRQAILGMAGTFKVSFAFEEVLAVREGYELHKPYTTQAEELVIVVADEPRYISLQHLLVVRHGEETHIINHWRQDWRYGDGAAYRYDHGNQWSRLALVPEFMRGQWIQAVYNVADSPRYMSIGRWRHGHGTSSWTGSTAMRPLPLRESHLSDQYDTLASVNTHVVTEKGWLHYQRNSKVDSSHAMQQTLALEQGINRYIRVPDQGFDKAHDYWKNTEVYWREVRSVWKEVLAEHEVLRLRKSWKGDPLFSHLFGLADEYWGQSDMREARPRIEEVIRAFVVKQED